MECCFSLVESTLRSPGKQPRANPLQGETSTYFRCTNENNCYIEVNDVEFEM